MGIEVSPEDTVAAAIIMAVKMMPLAPISDKPIRSKVRQNSQELAKARQDMSLT
jgi:hypothetical protein